ncbi:hypothetical protein [Streptomyces subrutilus]|uniref:hypothetical protein n=1 Tax=Streptomyces subrutilus TaxID=36818 RepID=UPI00340C911F
MSAAAAPVATTATTTAPVPAPADARVPAPAAAPTPAPAAPVREAVDPWAPPASRDAKRSWGPLTEGLNVPRDLDLGDRVKALEQLCVKGLAHATIVGVVKDVLPETRVGLLVGSRPWPLLAARMDQIRDQGGPGLLAAYLARLQADTTWQDGPASTTVGWLVEATPLLDDAALGTCRARVAGPRLSGGGPLPLHHDRGRRGPRPAGCGGSRGARSSAAGCAGLACGAGPVTSYA